MRTLSFVISATSVVMLQAKDSCQAFCVAQLGNAQCSQGSYCKGGYDCHGLFWENKEKTSICVLNGKTAGICKTNFPVLCSEAHERVNSVQPTERVQTTTAVPTLLPVVNQERERALNQLKQRVRTMTQNVYDFTLGGSEERLRDREAGFIDEIGKEFHKIGAKYGYTEESRAVYESLTKQISGAINRIITGNEILDIQRRVGQAMSNPDVQTFITLAKRFERFMAQNGLEYVAPLNVNENNVAHRMLELRGAVQDAYPRFYYPGPIPRSNPAPPKRDNTSERLARFRKEVERLTIDLLGFSIGGAPGTSRIPEYEVEWIRGLDKRFKSGLLECGFTEEQYNEELKPLKDAFKRQIRADEFSSMRDTVTRALRTPEGRNDAKIFANVATRYERWTGGTYVAKLHDLETANIEERFQELRLRMRAVWIRMGTEGTDKSWFDTPGAQEILTSTTTDASV